MGSMKDRLDAGNAEAWKPEPNDELIGKVVGLSRRTTEWGPYQIVTVQREDGTTAAFHAYHTVAANLLKDEQPGIGDEIGIRYLGKVDAPNSQYGSYEGYKLVVDHPDGWVPAMTPDDEADLATSQQAAAAETDKRDEDIPF
jgi:hypothetical protein